MDRKTYKALKDEVKRYVKACYRGPYYFSDEGEQIELGKFKQKAFVEKDVALWVFVDELEPGKFKATRSETIKREKTNFYTFSL